MSRFVHFATVDAAFVAGAPAAAAAAMLDVTPEYVGHDADGRFTFAVAAYDTTTHNHLHAIHVSLYEKTAAVPAPIVPADPAAIVAAPLHFFQPATVVTAPASVLAQTVVVDATSAPEGSYSAALVAEFDQ